MKRLGFLAASTAIMAATKAAVQRGRGPSPEVKRATGTEDLVIHAGTGRMRAARRLREHKAAQPDTGETQPSRQQLRREAVLKDRQALTIAKREASLRRLKGGSAVIRDGLDVARHLL